MLAAVAQLPQIPAYPAPDAGMPVWVWVLISLAGLAGKVVQDGIFRRRLEDRLKRMEEKDAEQQEEIAGLRERAVRLEAGQETERRLKHWYRNKLNGASNVIVLYRMTHGQHALDKFDWNPEDVPPFLAGDVRPSPRRPDPDPAPAPQGEPPCPAPR